ncbi:MAG: sugar phosphate isomerase/epimerase family protein [Planctomycetaceae bacterium]|nr:sugar phosphate isomerase/epimerase family protein [Planctomycetaceae bacterium]
MSQRIVESWPGDRLPTRPRQPSPTTVTRPPDFLRNRLSANGLTTIRWDMLKDVCGCRDAGIGAIGLWQPKVMEFGEERTAELLHDASLKVSSVSWAGGFTGTNGQAFREAVWEAGETIRLAGAVGADCVVVVSGSRAGHTLNHARRLLLEALRELTDVAEDAGVDLALQPMNSMFADWTFLTRLDDAVDMLALVNHPRLKLAFDTYHLWQEPNLLEQLPDLVPLIGVVQVSDWRDPPRSRHDRVLPGDGIIPLAPILETLIGAGYQRHFDLQVWSDELWQGDYLQLLRRGRQQFESLLPRLPSAVNPLG